MKQLSAITLKGILGLGVRDALVKYKFGKINLISGGNGTGKTRMLKLIQSITSERFVSAWIRTDDQGESEIIASFDGNDIDLTERIKINDEGTNRHMFTEDDTPINPGNYFSKALSQVAIDPAIFLDDANRKKRIEMTVKGLGVEITKADWIERGIPVEKIIPMFDFKSDMFGQFKTAEKALKDARLKVGQDKRASEATAKQLEDSLPQITLGEIDEEIAILKEKSAAIDQQVLSMEKKIADEFKQREIELSRKSVEIEAKITALKNELKLIENELIDIAESKDIKIADETKVFAERSENITLQINQANKKRDEILKTDDRRKLVLQHREKAEKSDLKWHAYDEYLTFIEDWKKELIDNLPIAGLSINDDLEINGVPWIKINTAKKVETFMQVVNHLSGDKEIKLILIDNLESLGEPMLDELIPVLEKSGHQMFLAWHDIGYAGDLKVNTFDSYNELKKEIIY